MKSLRQIISRYMYRITFILVGIILVFLLLIQMLTEQFRMVDDSHTTLQQIEQVLEDNHKELEELRREYRQTCLNNAELVARIIESRPEVLDSIDELKAIAETVEIDEIHIFDTTGRIFAGTHTQYYNYTFDSGEQIMFFKPMLEDKSLKLVQEITPNTAEEKPMQYSAVWSKSGEFIVQVGVEPVNVLKVTEKNELSYIFSLFRVDTDSNYYAIDCESGEIVGSTDLEIVGCKAAALGFNMDRIENDPDGFHNVIDGTLAFCVFTKTDANYIGRTVSAQNLYRRVPMTVFWIALSLFTMALILSKTVVRHMNKYVVQGIHDVNEGLLAVSEGNLATHVEVKSSRELSELSDYINNMLNSLLEKNRRIAYILSKTNLHIGTYEYGDRIEGVRFTEHIPVVFGKDAESIKALAVDAEVFKQFIDNVRSESVPNEDGIYQLGDRYIRIEEMKNEGNVFGLAVDVTEEIKRRKQIERERDIDTLTGLFNRRGLEIRLEELFAEPGQLGHSAVVMLDADGLKGINDTYGHEKGDIYLKKIANIINNFGIKSSVSSRLGGDEYVLFLYDYDSEDELMRTIETLRYIQSNSTASIGKNITVPMRFSFGYCITGDCRDYNKLLKEADEMMYRNKSERKKQLS